MDFMFITRCGHLTYVGQHLDCVLDSGNSDDPSTVAVKKAA